MKDEKFTVDVVTLRKLMIDKNITTISELSRVSGVNRNTLAEVLHEKIKPSSDVMYKLVDCLQIAPALAGEIFFGNNLRVA